MIYDEIEWSKVLPNDLSFGSAYKVIPSEGNMAWEYNPFRNYRISQDMYEYNNKLYTENEILKLIPSSGITDDYLSKNNILKYQKNELVDFVTDELSFDIEHPVTIIPSYSYDNSVDLILTDGKNRPRLINSRFSVTGKDTYKVIDRKGDNDTNIYDQGDQFEIDTSLYKRTDKIAKITFNGVKPGGNLKVGNYFFYFKYADADGNETDFIGESGLVSVFKGYATPASMNTGTRDENSLK